MIVATNKPAAPEAAFKSSEDASFGDFFETMLAIPKEAVKAHNAEIEYWARFYSNFASRKR